MRERVQGPTSWPAACVWGSITLGCLVALLLAAIGLVCLVEWAAS